ncbi:hypothetical protein [Lysobacter gummosus]|uniref:hypothetical protein n=1 Tax=Lysobacter gummosus TaxID=262324 RepID=UPI003631DE05
MTMAKGISDRNPSIRFRPACTSPAVAITTVSAITICSVGDVTPAKNLWATSNRSMLRPR